MSVVVFRNYFFKGRENRKSEKIHNNATRFKTSASQLCGGEANYSSSGLGSEERRGGFSHGTNLVVQMTYEHRRAVERISFLRAPNLKSRTSLERDGEERPLDPTSKQRR